MCAVFAPIINSYQRLVPGYEAPVYVGWARTNRSALIRVPSIRPQRPQSTRVELRCPDPSCNPYLALAVMLAAGIDGIERDLPLADPVEEDLYHMSADERASKDIASLPGTLGEAIEAMQADGIAEEALGSRIYNHLVEAQSREWAAYRMHVSPWVRDRYMEIY